MQISIDGPAASGKGTLAKTLAMKFGFDYLDTGTLYRAVARDALAQSVDLQDPEGQVDTLCQIAHDLALPLENTDGLRAADVAQAASKVASLSKVREALIAKQRSFAASPPSGQGAVLDGRDIGTVILPEADIKFYIDADITVRARRRHLELSVHDDNLTLAEVLADLTERDARDKNRATAPLIPADDAIFIDTSEKNAEEVLQLVATLVEERR